MRHPALPLIAASLLLATLCASCATTRSRKPGTPPDDGYIPSEEDVTTIPIPVSTTRSYFATIDSATLALVETGSPASLRQAAQALRRPGNEGYAENEKVLLVTATRMLEVAYPSETISWELPDVEQNPYGGALDSAKNGIYDSSTGNTDFLTLLLPSFVLFAPGSSTEYLGASQDALSQALELRPDSVIAHYLMGLLHDRMAQYDQAAEHLLAAHDAAPASIELSRQLAQEYYRGRQFDRCMQVAQPLLKQHPRDVTLLSLCAYSAFEAGDLDLSEDYVQQLLAIDGEELDYVLLRAKILMKKADYIRASSLLDVYSRTNRTGRDYLLLRSELQLEWNKNNASAADTIAQALAYYPDDPEVLQRAAEIASAASLSVGGQTALELSNRVLEKDPGNLSALQISVAEMVKAGDWAGAYQRSAQLVSRPDCPDSARYTHVDVCIAQGQTEEAWTLAQALYQADPTDEQATQAYIKALIATGRRDEATRLIDSLLGTANSRMKSILYYQRSRLDATEEAALSDLRSSLTANPRNEDALYRLYELYYQNQDWRRAQYYLKQVVALKPTDQQLLRLNAELDALLGR